MKKLTIFLSLVMMLMCLTTLASCKKTETIQYNDLVQKYLNTEKATFDKSQGYQIIAKIENDGLFEDYYTTTFNSVITYTYGSKNNIIWDFDDSGYNFGSVLVPYDLENGLYDRFSRVDFDKRDIWESGGLHVLGAEDESGIQYFYGGTLTPNAMAEYMSAMMNIADKWLFELNDNVMVTYTGDATVANRKCKIYEFSFDKSIASSIYISRFVSSVDYVLYIDDEYGFTLKWEAVGTVDKSINTEMMEVDTETDETQTTASTLTASFEIFDFKLGDDVVVPDMDLPIITENERCYEGDIICEYDWVNNERLSILPYPYDPEIGYGMTGNVVNLNNKDGTYTLMCTKVLYNVVLYYINTLKELFPEATTDWSDLPEKIFFTFNIEDTKITISFDSEATISDGIIGTCKITFEQLEIESSSEEEVSIENAPKTVTEIVTDEIIVPAVDD